jgi:hypothetical protein
MRRGLLGPGVIRKGLGDLLEGGRQQSYTVVEDYVRDGLTAKRTDITDRDVLRSV